MRDLIQDLLGYSRITAKVGPFVTVDLNLVIRDVLKFFEPLIEKNDARIEIGDLPVIEADPSQIQRLFHNLLDNALKFRRETEVPVVKIHGRTLSQAAGEHAGGFHPGQFCRITVEDNGIGFDEKYLERIFMPFKRLHSRSSAYKGTGMGLAICRKIAEVHGGAVSATSTPGKGSIFIVTLPGRHNSSF